ncbi:Hsp33 family molecular chaperone HslO [Chitinilyticum piscinae]|uniref:33 kDa chaperonin n=1 Tax=Chitinilyticum piscinae TaxID=2866724 RepID=A0A8J7FFW7_9NEIS|nr:Hsp33 family molecular chaperone HslO [Chitinilyticum piscinae]MBE9608643.1 Hsp33 family molecular chaperone HslO [Chitinilyticum piscinae]
MHDILERFLFDHAAVRGETVVLRESYAEVLARHPYPPVLARLLGELLAAGELLVATLKFDGTLILQLHGKGHLKLAVVEVTGEKTLRATARWDGEIPDVSLAELLGQGGRFVITIDPKDGEPYQGIVGFDKGESVATIIEHYMQRSAQIDTRVWLACDGTTASGLMLQKMPLEGGSGAEDEDAWPRVQRLAETITSEELLTLAPREMLHRLFHEETVRMFDPSTPTFKCTCSRERVGSMMEMVGREEVDGVLAERGNVEIVCDFCGKHYHFDAVDVAQLFAGEGVKPGNRRLQ